MYSFLLNIYIYLYFVFFNIIKYYNKKQLIKLCISEYDDVIVYEYEYNYDMHKNVKLWLNERCVTDYLLIDNPNTKTWNLYINENNKFDCRLRVFLDEKSLFNKLNDKRNVIGKIKYIRE